jgi:hypothetical protein
MHGDHGLCPVQAFGIAQQQPDVLQRLWLHGRGAGCAVAHCCPHIYEAHALPAQQQQNDTSIRREEFDAGAHTAGYSQHYEQPAHLAHTHCHLPYAAIRFLEHVALKSLCPPTHHQHCNHQPPSSPQHVVDVLPRSGPAAKPRCPHLPTQLVTCPRVPFFTFFTLLHFLQCIPNLFWFCPNELRV